MKKKEKTTVLLLALCLCLAACRKMPETNQEEPVTYMEDLTEADTKTDTQAEAEADPEVQKSIELVGPWHLDSEKNDLSAFADSLDLFPGYGEWGASMEIRSNGQMSWYIGAEGWQGTYTVEDGMVHARLTSDLEQSTQLWDFRIIEKEEATELEMDYKDMTIYWAYGDREDEISEEEADLNDSDENSEEEPWKTALAEDLFEKYGVLPEYYEDLGDGIYQVYVEVGGEIVPFVTVDSATGDYHG